VGWVVIFEEVATESEGGIQMEGFSATRLILAWQQSMSWVDYGDLEPPRLWAKAA
jgi:hypothetical protein